MYLQTQFNLKWLFWVVWLCFTWIHVTVEGVSLAAQWEGIQLPMQEIWVRPLGYKDPVGKVLAPTPVLLPGKSHGQRSLAGYSPRGHKRVGHNLVTKQQQQPFKTGSRFMIHVAWRWPGTLIVTGNEDYAIYLSLNIPSYPCLVSLLIIAGTTGPLDANLILLVSKTYPDLK